MDFSGEPGLYGLAVLVVIFWVPLMVGLKVCKLIGQAKDKDIHALLWPWIAVWLIGWWFLFWWVVGSLK
jgi:hypothetical protein